MEDASTREELLVGAALGDPAALHHEDLIARRHGGESMADEDDRPCPLERLERLDHAPLVLGVEGARRLVEDDDGRLAEERARDGDALGG